MRYKFSVAVSIDQIKPIHVSLTVNKDEPYEMACTSENEIEECLFTNPSETSFILWAGASYVLFFESFLLLLVSFKSISKD